MSHRRTPYHSYTALGLLSSLNPRAKGGAETVPDVTLLPKSVPPAANTSTTAVASASLPKGHGRITRDEHGHVVDVQLNEEDRDEDMKRDKEDETPWGATMEDWGNEGTAMPEIEGKTKVIKGTLQCISNYTLFNLRLITFTIHQLSSPTLAQPQRPRGGTPRTARSSGCARS